MSRFTKYIGCDFLICHNTFDVIVKSRYDYDFCFEKGMRYECSVYRYDYDDSMVIEFTKHGIIFDDNIEDSIYILDNFHTLTEHRNSIIDSIN